MTDTLEFNTPWTLHFDRDGTEDIAIICDGDMQDLVRSHHFLLPEGDDPVPATLSAMRLMTAAPELQMALLESSKLIYYLWKLLADSEDQEAIRAKCQYRLDENNAAIAKATGAA